MEEIIVTKEIMEGKLDDEIFNLGGLLVPFV
jgi:hypothetical protein